MLKKQIDFFKVQKTNFEYDYNNFLILIESFQTSQNYERNILWLQIIIEIIRLNPNLKKNYFKIAMKIVFSPKSEENNINCDENKEEINNIKINAISNFTNNCEDIFQCDTYFQNFARLKSLLQLLMLDFFPHHYNQDNNKVLLLISNIFMNINKDKESKMFLKNNYFSIMFNLLMEMLCFLCLNNSLKIIEIKTKSTSSNSIKEEEQTKKYLDLIDKSNKLFDLYLNFGEKNNLDLIINNQMLMQIFIIHCLESQYNEPYCIEWFKKLYNCFRINKILKMITDIFDDEIFDLFYINENIFDEERSPSKTKRVINNKLKFVNNFFYLSDNHTKEVEMKNSYNIFLNKFHKLTNKLKENKELVYNGLFILINLLFNEISSKKEPNIDFKEEFIILTLIKCVMKYIAKTNVIEMIEVNKTNIDNLINILIDRFGFSLSGKIWKELLLLIKCFYSELSKKDNQNTIIQLSIILKKMIRLKINGVYLFDEKLFYDLINKVCESKSNNIIIDDYVLFSIYFKNKFKSSKTLDKSISSLSNYFINIIKENYNNFELNQSIFTYDNDNEKKEKEYNLSSEKVLEIFAKYILIYFSAYSKYENKNVESFLINNLKYLNFLVIIKKNLRSQYIQLIIKVLNNTSDLNYFQYMISYIISLHSSENEIFKTEQLMEKSLYLYRKILIKLINQLAITYQIQKLNYLFESILNRLEANLKDDIDYNFLKNILDIFSYINITKYNEILINNKIPLKKRTTDIISKNYFSIGKNRYSSLISKDEKYLPKKANEEWCIIDIKEIFVIIIKILKKKNIDIVYKEKILNFIKEKINDIFFFNKIDVNLFINYVIELDNDNLKEFIQYADKKVIILIINDILKNIVYLLLNNKGFFDIKDREGIYEKIINYVYGKINYFKKLIGLIIKKYNIKIIKNKNYRHFMAMKKILGVDNEGNPNILNLKIDQSDFKFSSKDKEKDVNYKMFIDEEIDLSEFVYPKINLKEILNYFKSYLDILEISLNSLICIHIKNINLINNISFVKQIERELKFSFDKNIKMDNFEEIENVNKKNESISDETRNKYKNICDKLFNIFNKFPSIIKYNNNFLYDIYKLFLYCKDFIIFCGEKYIIQAILILFSIAFSELPTKLFNNLNNEFKSKYNNGKDFIYKNIESISIDNLSSSKQDINDSKDRRINSTSYYQSNSFLKSYTDYIKPEKSNSETVITGFNQNDKDNYVSKSVINLQNENTKEKEELMDRQKSSDECFTMGSSENNNFIYKEMEEISEPNKTFKEKCQNKIFLIRRILIEFIINSTNSLKIFHIINNEIKENDKIEDEGIVLFLLLCKWRIINSYNLNRKENINIFKNRTLVKNYFNKDIFNISIENTYQKETAAIKSPISSFNYIINNNSKNIQNKDALKILSQSLVSDKNRKNVEEILYQKYSQENNKLLNSLKNSSNRNRSNQFLFKSSNNVLNEIKESEEDNSNSDEKSNKEENGEEKNVINEELNIPNLEGLISIMHGKTKNNTFKIHENILNRFANKFNNLDKGFLYNELIIYVSYIINKTNKGSMFNLHNSTFMKFLKKLTIKEESGSIPYNQIKLNEQKEFIFLDNFNITKYILNSLGSSSDINNCQIYLIFNDTLQNKSNNSESLIKNNIDMNNEYIYLYIFIIPVSEDIWKIQLRINQKKSDEFSIKLKNMIKMNFLDCYYFSIKNNFGYILYHLKILFSLLQDLICNIKSDISDKKMRNKLTGIKHEELIDRVRIFKSINAL